MQFALEFVHLATSNFFNEIVRLKAHHEWILANQGYLWMNYSYPYILFFVGNFDNNRVAQNTGISHIDVVKLRHAFWFKGQLKFSSAAIRFSKTEPSFLWQKSMKRAKILVFEARIVWSIILWASIYSRTEKAARIWPGGQIVNKFSCCV